MEKLLLLPSASEPCDNGYEQSGHSISPLDAFDTADRTLMPLLIVLEN